MNLSKEFTNATTSISNQYLNHGAFFWYEKDLIFKSFGQYEFIACVDTDLIYIDRALFDCFMEVLHITP